MLSARSTIPPSSGPKNSAETSLLVYRDGATCETLPGSLLVRSSNIRDRMKTYVYARVCIRMCNSRVREEKKEREYTRVKLRTRFLRFVPGTVEIHYSRSVMPGNATGRCTSHIHFAGEAYRATFLHVDVFRSQDRRLSSCNTC